MVIFFNIQECCVYLLESPYQGDSYEYHNIRFQDKIRDLELSQMYQYALMEKKILGTSDLVQNSHGKCAVGVQAIQCRGTSRSEQTVQSQIRLLLKGEPDQGLHCLPLHLNL